MELVKMYFEAKDLTVIPWNDLESSGMLSYPNNTQDMLLSHNFPDTRSKVKTCQWNIQSAYPNNELSEMRFTAYSFAEPPTITSELPLTRFSALNYL